MLGSTVLEVTLGLCVYYIALSLVCSGIAQYFSEWMKNRSRLLVGVLSELVNHTSEGGDSMLARLLADARIAGGVAETTQKEKSAPKTKGLVLPAGGRIDKFAFTDVFLDLATSKLIKAAAEATPPAATATDADKATPETNAQLVDRMQVAINALQTGITVSLAGSELLKWDKILGDIKARTAALAGLPIDEVNRQAEAIFKELQIAATAETQQEVRSRLLAAIGMETEAVLGLARRMNTARALALVAKDMPDSPFQSFLIRLANRGALEPDEAKKAIQDWYSSVNDRVSVEFRGKSQKVLFITTVFVTLMLNADTLQMANRLVRDEALRKVVAQEALELATTANRAVAPKELSTTDSPAKAENAAPKNEAATKEIATKSANAAAPTEPAKTGASTAPDSATAPAEHAKKTESTSPAKPPSTAAEAAAGPLEQLNIPLRWTDEDWNTLKGLADYSQPQKIFNGLYKIVGLLITALALTMGAEFWYNLLKQLVPAFPGRSSDKVGRA